MFPLLTSAIFNTAFLDFQAPGVTASPPWNQGVIDSVIEHRLAGTALRLHGQGRLRIPEAVVVELRNASFSNVISTLHMVKVSSLGLKLLIDHGIEFVITKGPAIASMGFGITDRPFGDLDVLVRPRDFRRAQMLLRAIGYEERATSRPPWPYFNRHCREAVNLHSRLGGSIDLHHHVPPWLWSKGLVAADLIEAREVIEVGGTELLVVPPELNLLIVSLHIVSDRGRPGATVMAWRDLLVLAKRSDPHVVVEQASRTGLLPWLRWILLQYPREIAPEGLLAVCGDVDHSKIVVSRHWRLRQMVSPKFATNQPVGHILRLPTARTAVYIVGMVLPSKAFLREQYPDGQHRIRMWWRSGVTNLLKSASINPSVVKIQGRYRGGRRGLTQ